MHTIRLGFVALSLAAAAACSNGTTKNDAGTDAAGEAAPSTFTQTGQVIDFSNMNGLSGITVSGAGNSVTTNATGNYTLSVPQNTAYTMQVVGADAGYTSLNEQEWMLTGNANRGTTSFVAQTTEALLQSALEPKPNPMLAVLSVQVQAEGSCSPDAGGPDVTGATISVPGLGSDGGTGPQLVYFSNGFPSAATSVQAGQLPSAIIYNLQPTTSTSLFNSVTVTHPTCTQKAFPTSNLSAPTIVYTGNVRLDVAYPTGSPPVVSFMRVFLE